MAEEQKDNPQTEKPAEKAAEPTKPVPPAPPAPPAGEPKAAAPKPPPPPPGAKPAAPAAPPKPKGPQQEPWTSPLVDALKEKFGGEFVKSYSFLGQNQIEVKKDRIAEIMTFFRDNPIVPFNYLVDETAVHWPKEEQFEIVYILYSFEKNDRIRVEDAHQGVGIDRKCYIRLDNGELARTRSVRHVRRAVREPPEPETHPAA